MHNDQQQFTGIRVGGEEIRIWNDEHFKRLRTLHGLSDDFLETSISLKNLKNGGGKGGSLMTLSECRRFLVKEMSPGDHRALLDITPDLIDHLTRSTLLCPLYLHFCVASSGRKFIAMGNMLRHPGPWVAKFDLKGCADDKTLERDQKKVQAVHKRIWKVPMWLGKVAWSDARKDYHSGKKAARKLKLPVTTSQREGISRRLKYDCDFLATRNLMDYSLVVGVRWISFEELERDPSLIQVLNSPDEELRQPLLCEDRGGVSLLYLGVIDYLQTWGCGKNVAQCIKVAERNKATIPPVPYGRRFCEHFDRLFVAAATPVAQKLPRVGLSDVNGNNGLSTTYSTHTNGNTTELMTKEIVNPAVATPAASVKSILLSQGAMSTSSKMVNFSKIEGYADSPRRPAYLPALDDVSVTKEVFGPPGADGSGCSDNLVLLDPQPKQSCCCWLLSMTCKLMFLTLLLCLAWLFWAPHLGDKMSSYELYPERAHHKDRTFTNSQMVMG